MYRMFYLGGNFMSSLICIVKTKKNLKTFSKKTGFFQPWYICLVYFLSVKTLKPQSPNFSFLKASL